MRERDGKKLSERESGTNRDRRMRRKQKEQMSREGEKECERVTEMERPQERRRSIGERDR